MCNDISARDVQLQKGQFYESKSYPTFTPTGPRLVLLEADEFARLSGLRLRLWVNGELRQDRDSGRPDHRAGVRSRSPASSNSIRATCFSTGTPGGTALQARRVVLKVGDLLPAPVKWRTFFARQERNPAYLKAGDVITASIATADGERLTWGPSAPWSGMRPAEHRAPQATR